MPEILVLCPGREGRRVIEAQLRRLRVEAVYVTTRSELWSGAMERGPKAVVTDLFDGEGRPVAPFLRELNREVPDLQIVISYHPSPAALDDVLDVATSGLRVAFAARPFKDVGRLLEPLLLSESTCPPSTAESILLRVVPHADTEPARRYLTLASVNPVPLLDVYSAAQSCGVTHRTLYRHLDRFGPPKLLLSAFAWPQVNYLLTGLHWTARQVAAYCGLRRPVLLIDILGDYLESGLWKLGLDPSVDSIAAATAGPHDTSPDWPDLPMHGGPASAFGWCPAEAGTRGTWQSLRLQQVNGTITTLARSGMTPLEIVRRLWRRHELDPGRLYRGVMQTVTTLPPGGPVKSGKA